MMFVLSFLCTGISLWAYFGLFNSGSSFAVFLLILLQEFGKALQVSAWMFFAWNQNTAN